MAEPLKAEKDFVEMPNLIDTGDSDADNFFGTDDSSNKKMDQNAGNPTTHSPLIDDLFGGGVGSMDFSQPENNDDPFADVSFHNNEGRDHTDDIFTDMTVSEKQGTMRDLVTANTNGTGLFDAFQSSPKVSSGLEVCKNDATDLIAGLSISEDASKTNNQKGTSILEKYPAGEVSSDSLSKLLGSQGFGANGVFGNGSIPNGLLPGMMLNPALAPQPVNYGPITNFFDQQQLLATMAHFQNLGNLNAESISCDQVLGVLGGNSSPFPDIFQSNLANQPPTSTMTNLKKEDTKAFDFISVSHRALICNL